MTPEKFRVPFRTFEFLAYQPGVSIVFARTDIPPGVKVAADIAKAQGVVAGGLGPENSKDLMIRLGLDMLGVKYGYVTSYRGSPAARLALQQGEINLFSESPPSYRSLVVPTLVKTGIAMPIWYDPIYDGETFGSTRQLEGLSIPSFPELYRQIKGTMPSGKLWDVYRAVITVHGAMQRLFVLPPGVPQAAVDALRAALANSTTTRPIRTRRCEASASCRNGSRARHQRVRQALTGQPEARAFLNDYIPEEVTLHSGAPRSGEPGIHSHRLRL